MPYPMHNVDSRKRSQLWRDLFPVTFAAALSLFTIYILITVASLWGQRPHRTSTLRAVQTAPATGDSVRPGDPTLPDTLGDPQTAETESDTECDPENPPLNLADALLCFAEAVAGDIGETLEGVVEVAIKVSILCFGVPFVLLVLAVSLYFLGESLARRSRRCRRTSWWRKLWCALITILTWIVRVLAVVSVIAAIIVIVYCVVEGLAVAA